MDEVQMGEGQDQDRPVIADLLTGQPREATELEDLVQRTVVVLAGEYERPALSTRQHDLHGTRPRMRHHNTIATYACNF